MGNYFAYARVSTPRQGERGVSLQEQRDAIERYSRIHGLSISRWFEDRESASHTGRTAFSEMLRLLRMGKTAGVVIHKIDRSARNLDDWVDVSKLSDAGVEVHFAAENVDLKTVSGRLSADIQAVVASHYSRNLREEVKKGLYGRVKQGFYPWRAPVGYLDQGSAKPKQADPIRAPLICEAFGLYSTGRVSLPQLVKAMFARGLRNSKGGPVSVNGMATILRNPFYIGLIRIYKTGQSYEGRHEPIISPKLFEETQLALAGKKVDRSEAQVFTYSRRLKCQSCGYSLIAEKHKGHVYYRCHNRPFKTPAVCPATSIREEEIDKEIVATLQRIDLSDEELDLGRTTLAARREEAAINREAHINSVRLQLEALRSRQAKAADLLLDGVIERTIYDSKQNDILMAQSKLRAQLIELERGNATSIEQIEKTVELAKSPSIQYNLADSAKRREFSKILLSNLTVSQKKVSVTLAAPFNFIADRVRSEECRPYRGDCRTWEQLLEAFIEEAQPQYNLKKAA